LQAKHGIGAHLLGWDDLEFFHPQLGNYGEVVEITPCARDPMAAP
jgi:hypothetical protein